MATEPELRDVERRRLSTSPKKQEPYSKHVADTRGFPDFLLLIR
jgi:hypothetical protein